MTKLEQKRFCMQMIVHYEDMEDEINYDSLYDYYLVHDHCQMAIQFWQDKFQELIDEK